MDKTSLEHHIKHLEQQHRDIDNQINEDYKNYGEDRLVTTLKKKKLHLKDEIEMFRKQLETI